MKRLLIPLLALAALAVPAIASSASAPRSITIEVASVNLKAESITSTDGATYFVTDSTRFHPTAFPAGPKYAGSVAWNALVSQTTQDPNVSHALLAILNTGTTNSPTKGNKLPPCWLVPPIGVPCDPTKRYLTGSATSNNSELLLTDVTLALPPS